MVEIWKREAVPLQRQEQVLGCLFGWMTIMGMIWWMYTGSPASLGGMKGTPPENVPAKATTPAFFNATSRTRPRTCTGCSMP